MDGDRPVVDGRELLEFELQDLIRKVWNEACKYRDALYYAGVDKEVFLRGYDCDIHELLISYLDCPTSDMGSEEGAMGDGARLEGYLRQLTSREPDEIKISEDGTAIFKSWKVLQNPR